VAASRLPPSFPLSLSAALGRRKNPSPQRPREGRAWSWSDERGRTESLGEKEGGREGGREGEVGWEVGRQKEMKGRREGGSEGGSERARERKMEVPETKHVVGYVIEYFGGEGEEAGQRPTEDEGVAVPAGEVERA